MPGRSRPRLPAKILSWAAANTVAGLGTSLALGAFLQGGIDRTLLLISVLFGNVVGFTVLLSSELVFPRVRPLGPFLRAALLVLTLVCGSVAGSVLVLFLFPLYVLRDLPQTLAVLAINAVLALIVGSVVYAYEDLSSRLAESLREVEEVRLVEAQLKEAAARAELSALQARINPHFFFNTLNTISSLVVEDPARAEEVVQMLADLFRYTFRASDTRPVRLSEELAFIEGYLAIEKARFGERLRVETQVEAAALAVPVPGLILQPLVENAVGHGLAPLSRGGTIRISARLAGNSLVVEVADDGAGLRGRTEGLVRDGHGLGNVLKRLKTLYRHEGTVALGPGREGRGAVARIRLPAPPPEGAAGGAPGALR